MIVITVARKPLSAGNVASNVLAHGTGALNIGASRLTTSDDLNGGAYSSGASERHDGAENWRYKRGDHGGAGEFKPPPGRWPANLVLGHMPGCRQEGTVLRGSGKYVPNDGVQRTSDMMSPGKGWNANQMSNSVKNAPNSYGVESVPAWHCADDCPVRELDALSGESKSSGFGGRVVVKRRTGAERDGNLTPRFGAESRPDGAVMSSYDDAGGPSRFFKQVGGNKS